MKMENCSRQTTHVKFGGKEKRKVGRSLRGRASLRKGFWKVERRESVERERLKIQEDADDDATILEPEGHRSTWNGQQGV